MTDFDRHAHWQNVYATKGEGEVSWFQASPVLSLDLIAATGVAPEAPIIDIGGGGSRLVDHLLERGHGDVTVLDVSEEALEVARARLGERAARVRWIAADVTAWTPERAYAVWHDRAAFHFLTDEQDRLSYLARLTTAVRPHGHVIIGTFALDGPERCSGLPVMRYDAASLAETLGPFFRLIETRASDHRTPAGGTQRFQFSRFQRV